MSAPAFIQDDLRAAAAETARWRRRWRIQIIISAFVFSACVILALINIVAVSWFALVNIACGVVSWYTLNSAINHYERACIALFGLWQRLKNEESR